MMEISEATMETARVLAPSSNIAAALLAAVRRIAELEEEIGDLTTECIAAQEKEGA